MLRKNRLWLLLVLMTGPVAFIISAAPAGAQGWSLQDANRTLGKIQRYMQAQLSQVRFSDDERRPGSAVLVMKLGMGIPYCKGHRASIAVREGRNFRVVARARTMRGVTSATIGLTAARLDPGTYYIVRGYCHVRRRHYNVGRPLDSGRDAGRRKDGRLFRSAYAKFTIEPGQVLNAGFLRFFPPSRRGGRLKIKLQSVPGRDLRFLARRYPELGRSITKRLMARTSAAGQSLSASRAPKTPPGVTRLPALRRAEPKRTIDDSRVKIIRAQPAAVSPPVATPASSTPPQVRTPALVRIPPLVRAPGASPPATGRRRAACKALLQLKREGKVQKVPKSCARFGASGRPTTVAGQTVTGLPPAIGPDK